MEGIPRALMEAMSMGKTCLGPRIAGVDELIEDGRTGYLFDPGSDSDLFAKMEQVVIGGQYLDPAVVSKHIESQFSAEIGAARTAEVYTRIATSRLTRTRRQSHLHQADGLPSGARTHSLEEGY
jgi:glycosyltransferase involved in cell wall biosynthesis